MEYPHQLYTINDTIYATDTQKVSSALTYFKIGTPGRHWASDQMKAALDANPVDYGTWNNFKTAFEQQFIPPAAQMEAIQKMHDGNKQFFHLVPGMEYPGPTHQSR